MNLHVLFHVFGNLMRTTRPAEPWPCIESFEKFPSRRKLEIESIPIPKSNFEDP